MFVYKYGANLQTAFQHTAFQASAVAPSSTDRAGAASNVAVFEIVSRLRDRWSTTNVSQNINWEIWANEIAQKPTHEHEFLISQPPPRDIIHLFRHSPTDGDAVVSSVRRDNNMVIAVLEDLEAQLKEIEHDFTARFNRMLAGINRYQLQAIALHNALRPEEHPFNAAILEQIDNLDDFDHQ
jgi:hypothetical protein